MRKTYAPEAAMRLTETAARIYRARIGRFSDDLKALHLGNPPQG